MHVFKQQRGHTRGKTVNPVKPLTQLRPEAGIRWPEREVYAVSPWANYTHASVML